MMRQRLFLAVSFSLLMAGTSVLASTGEPKGETPPAVVSAKTAGSTAVAAPSGQPAALMVDQSAPFTLEGTDLGRMLKRDASNVSIMRVRGGATRLNVGGGFRSVLVVRITPDSKVETSCIISEKDAERIFAPKPDKVPESPQGH